MWASAPTKALRATFPLGEGFEELMAEKEADAAKFDDFAGAQVFDTP